MNNLKYFPFERNRYYYGKLLTEQDFIQEQQYFNDKRRLHNRFLHGVGVAAGLRVVMVDEKSISVEDGVAFDFSGREILVDIPSVYRLSTIDGFDTIMEQGKGDYAYLCISYDEQGAVPTHNITTGDIKSEDVFDKTRENYHLYLTDKEPDNIDMTLEGLFLKKEIIYEDKQIRITQTFPQSIMSGDKMETTIEIENISNAVQISVEIEENIEKAFCNNESVINVKWDNIILERGEKQSKTFILKVMELEHGSVNIQAIPEKIVIKEGNDILYPQNKKNIEIPITHKDNIQSMTERYFDTVMEKISINNYPQRIYLAKISIIKIDNSYMIENIEQIPFNQYIYSTFLLMGITYGIRQELKTLKTSYYNYEPKVNLQKKEYFNNNVNTRKKQGVVQINLGIGGKREQSFFSHEIIHGLGIGPVNIELSIQQDDLIYFGSSEIFNDMDVKAELAAKLDTSKGSFVIGVRLTEPTSRQYINVCWRAVAETLPEDSESDKKYMYIIPNKLELKVRESYYLKAVCENMPYATIIWSVNGKESGSIASDGTYTAPSFPGVYEVTAQCQEAPEIKASIFIVVRE